jgi:peptidyl-prolyl cis-trans isomerase C
MKITYLSLALSAVLAAGNLHAADAPAPAAPAEAAAAALGDVPLATVNGIPYSLDMFRLFYMERLQQSQAQDSPELQQLAFNEFINLVLTAQQAETLKLTERPDVQIGMELQRIKLLSNIALQAMAQELQPSDEELKAGYDDLVKQMEGTQYKVRQILVQDEATAKKVIAELDKGGDFSKLAAEHSTGPNAKAGGELGWFSGKAIDNQPFADAVAGLKKGEYTKTPIEAKYGWHVILLDDTRTQAPPTLDEAKPQLIAGYQRMQLANKIGALREDAKLDLNESVVKLKEAPAPAPETK